MVAAPRAGCGAALSLWVVSGFLCRAWTAPSPSLLEMKGERKEVEQLIEVQIKCLIRAFHANVELCTLEPTFHCLGSRQAKGENYIGYLDKSHQPKCSTEN
uniref:Uncharacterized protein n=1 Tax=Prolemur simus TaxID=1328070 RepID=A0A8C8YL35_PROSS